MVMLLKIGNRALTYICPDRKSISRLGVTSGGEGQLVDERCGSFPLRIAVPGDAQIR